MSKAKRISGVLVALLWGAGALHGQGTKPDFSGVWKKDDALSVPVRPGEVTMKIEEHDPSMTVEMTVVRPGDPPQHATQAYKTDGTETVSIGADGDEFHTKVVRGEGSLLFTVEEHEDGRLLHSTEIWTLSPDGRTLTRVRHTEKSDQKIVYVRQG